MLLETKTSGPIDVDFGNLQLLQSTSTIKLDPMKIEEKILLSPFDFVNYIEIKMPEKEAKLQKDVFPLKIYESEKKSKFTFCELNPKKELSTKLYTELNAVIFYMVLEDKLIFGDDSSNIKFYSLKENKVIKTLQYPLKNTPEIYKSYAMDISPDEIFSFVGYENGQIALFEKVKCKQVIKTGNNFSIINIKLYHQTKKQLQILYSDIKGNVMLVSLKAKTFGNFEEQIESICKGNVNAPYYLINILKFKDTETIVNKSLKDLNDTFALVSSENVVLYTYNEDFNKIHTFKKPKYIRDNSLPDVVIGLGKQPSNNESTDGDADLLVLYLISWEKVIYLHVLPFMNNTLDFVIDSGFYVNEAPIIKIGFLNLSTIYLIDIEGNFKILSSRKFNQGLISIDEKKRIPIIPENNKNAELQDVIKIGKMKSHSYLKNKQLETYIERYDLNYSISDNRILKLMDRNIPLSEAELQEKGKTRNEKFIIVTCARFAFPHKGYIIGLLNEFKKLKTIHEKVKLIIVGYNSEVKFDDVYNQLPNKVKESIELKGEILYSQLIELYRHCHLAIGLAGSISASASIGLPSLIVRHDTYMCETYGFYHTVKNMLNSEPGEDILPYILHVINCTEQEYVSLGMQSCEKFFQNNIIEPDYILKQTNYQSKSSITYIDRIFNIIFVCLSLIKKIMRRINIEL